MPEIKRLFYDLETSPNIMFSWRAGYKINLDHDNIIKERAIICVCYKWENSPKIYSMQWNNGDDRQLVEDFAFVANEADELVAHNGDRFDIRWFNGRNLMHDMPPIPEYKTVDTCSIAKRKFALNSYRLDYLAKILLGEGKIKTEFSMWKDICLHNDPNAMKKMVKYCKRDVALLQRVWEYLKPYYTPKTHEGVLNGDGRWSCPGCGADDIILSKTRATPMGMPRYQMQCKECGRYFTVSSLVYRQFLEIKASQEAVEGVAQ